MILALGGSAPVRAADVDSRHFRILIDDKPAGDYHMTISRQDDGTVTMAGNAEVSVRRLGFVVYHYSYNGSEVWKDARLLRLQSTCNDDGKQFAVSAQADGDALRVKVNNQERLVRKEVWTTSCWSLPAAQFRNQALSLLDADTGREINGRLQYIATTKMSVTGQVQDCVHYRVSGGVQLELWFDGQERLVRQESMEDGHRTVLELAGH